MPTKLTTEEFITKAKQVHGDKYSYDLVKYVNNHIKVKIICPIHGVFEQMPYSHLNGNGCKVCGYGKSDVTTDIFINKAKQAHGDKYSYDLVEYVNNCNKVKIVCPIHGVFEQTPHGHLRGKGCKICGRRKSTVTTNDFINKAKQVHGDRYSYDLVQYINNYNKVKITCPIHGVFKQKPNSHLNGHGCPDCGGRKKHTIDTFITKANKVHGDRYSYDLVEYVNNKTKVKIVCSDHGVFEQTPNDHLDGCKCPTCSGVMSYTNSNIIDMLTIEEDPVEIDGTLYCRCSKCKEYFIPTRSAITQRYTCLLGKQGGECRLYCSDKCKNECSLYYRKKYPKGHLPDIDTSRPDQPELRNLTLERDNYQCQRCGSTEDLVCHHLTGVEINPVESADVDNCITLCYNCHQRVHSGDECNMRREKCV